MGLEKLQEDTNSLKLPKSEPLSDSTDDEVDTVIPQNDATSIVTSVIHERGKELLSVHSHKSMTRLILQSHQKLKNQQHSQGFGAEAELMPPIVVNHKDDDGARIAETKNMNKLPFKNRNPAV